MKAIVVENYGGPDVLTSREVTKPQPESGQILVRLHAAGVNPVDTYLAPGHRVTPRICLGLRGWTGPVSLRPSVRGQKHSLKAWRLGAEFTRPAHSQELTPNTVCVHPPKSSLFRRIWTGRRGLPGCPLLHRREGSFYQGEHCREAVTPVHGATGGVGMAALQLAADRGLRLLGSAGSESGTPTG